MWKLSNELKAMTAGTDLNAQLTAELADLEFRLKAATTANIEGLSRKRDALVVSADMGPVTKAWVLYQRRCYDQTLRALRKAAEGAAPAAQPQAMPEVKKRAKKNTVDVSALVPEQKKQA